MNFNDLKNDIRNTPTDYPVYIYVAVGAAAGPLSPTGVLAQENYHQYPPFLQELRNTVPDLRLFIVLIDPQQEDPPYVEHMNRPRLTQVYVFRQNVHTDVNENPCEGSINITDELRQLNQFAIDQRASLLYHDFTGRAVRLLAEYFDYELAPHLDYIVYGLSAREDHGCYFDLTQPASFFAFRLDLPAAVSAFRLDLPAAVSAFRLDLPAAVSPPRPLLKVFNYFKYIINHSWRNIEAEMATYPHDKQYLIREQKNQIMNDIIKRFRHFNIAMLRQLRKKQQAQQQEQAPGQAPGQAQAPEQAPAQNEDDEYHPEYLFMHLPKMQYDMYMDLWRDKHYDLLYDVIFLFCANQLQVVAQLREMDLNGDDILKFITMDADPYKWYKTIDEFLPKA
jgi:hypothetical protein